MSTITTKKKAGALVGLVAGLTLALSACGGADAQKGGGDAGSGEDGGKDKGASQSQTGSDPTPTESALTMPAYDFEGAKVAGDTDEMPSIFPGDPFEVRLSDELKGAIPDGKSVAVEKYVVTPKAFTTGICRLDVAVHYNHGGLESVKTPTPGDAKQGSVEATALYNLTDRSSGFVAVDDLPSDEEVEEDTIYMTKDLGGFSVVEECNEDPADMLSWVSFPYVERGEKPKDQDFAAARVSVMDGGSAAVTGETKADLSASGAWKKPTAEG